MADEVSNAELARRLGQLADDVRGDFAEVFRRMDSYVLREVYAAEKDGRDRRIDALEQKVREAEDQRRALVRWVVGAILVPAVVLVVQVVLALQGPP